MWCGVWSVVLGLTAGNFILVCRVGCGAKKSIIYFCTFLFLSIFTMIIKFTVTITSDSHCHIDEFDCTQWGSNIKPNSTSCSSSGDSIVLTQSQFCIPRALHCNEEATCPDALADELGCSMPIITHPPPITQHVLLGGSFQLLCVAMGVPLPTLVWRFNDGHVPRTCLVARLG